ncbi:MAG: alpha-E domain-containing protein [Chromatiales bacterium]|jgi:uncharacterized alpha-E superfamily protein
MLSRVAERVYWTGRYIERAESTARLVNAYTNQVLDLPKGTEPGWRTLVDISGTTDLFEGHYQNADERNTVKFLLIDAFNPASILSSLAMARENVRTTRDVLPTEAWEHTNELYLYAKNHVQSGLARRNRFYFLKNILFRCQQVTGLLDGTMSHDAAYDFVRAGRNLERADMTTRIVDSAVFLLLPRKDEPGEYDNILWVSVLKSLSAFQMYRQHVRNRVVGDEVVRYLLKDDQFPRSVSHSVSVAELSLNNLPRNEAPLRSVARLRRRLNEAQTDKMSLEQLHAFIDELQAELNTTHESISNTWFNLDQPMQQQAQSS